MINFQYNEKVIISNDCPHHGGKQGRFQFITEVAKNTVAIIEDSISKRQFKVGIEYVQKTKV